MSKIKEKLSKEERFNTTTKRLVTLCLINGILWVWCSYILAFLGMAVIAESLSQVAITEILGVFLVYALKSLFENLSKNNHWPDKSAQEPVDMSNWDDAADTTEGE